jgi:hypothetical protein
MTFESEEMVNNTRKVLVVKAEGAKDCV